MKSFFRHLRWWLDDGGLGKAADLAIKVVGVVAALLAVNLFARSPVLTTNLSCETPIDKVRFVAAYGDQRIPADVMRSVEQYNEDNGQLVPFVRSVGASSIRLTCSHVLNIHDGLPQNTPQRTAKVAVLRKAYPESLTSFGEGNSLVPNEILQIGTTAITAKDFEKAVTAIESARFVHFQIAVTNDGPGTATGVSIDHPADFTPTESRSKFELADNKSESANFATTDGTTTLRAATIGFPVDFESSKSIDAPLWSNVLIAVLFAVAILTIVQIALSREPESNRHDD